MTDPVVELKSGFVRGVIEKHEDGFNYYSFKSIPYAEPPIGELRFQDPQPKKKWTGTIDCKNFGSACLQYDAFLKTTSYSEDCLHLNVYTRSIDNSNTNYPVIVVVHGGAFLFGNANDDFYGPEYLIRKNVVLVMVNFRIGILGFLNLEDEVAPGNQGLKDIVMALRWVQQNVRAFGGNPDNVTVYGAAAGGVASHLLAISPMTKGLMHKVICQAATIYSVWVGYRNHKDNAITLCSMLGRELTDSREIFEFLKAVDCKSLQEAQLQLTGQLEGIVPFGPSTDSQSPDPFMPFDLLTMADRGIHLPCLTGYTSEEGLLILIGKSKEDYFQTCDKDFGKWTMKYNIPSLLAHYNLTEMQFRRLYFKSDNISVSTQDKLVELVGDVLFLESIHRLARVQAEKGSAPTYLYKYSYDQPNGLLKVLMKAAPAGASHLDDLPFLFQIHVFEKVGREHFKKGSREYKLMEQMTEMWVNFATYGRPTVDTSDLIPVHWKPIADGTLLRYLNIDDDITMQSTVNVEQKFLSAKDIKV